MSKPLYKTSIVIWSEFDPTQLELSQLAREAESGAAYCANLETKKLKKPTQDPDWDGTEFFSSPTLTRNDPENPE